MPEPDEDGGPPRPPKVTARALEDEKPEDGSILDEIARRMAMRFPEAIVKRGKDFIAYYPFWPDGFIVRLVVNKPGKNRYAVYYNGSCEHFSDRRSAILHFATGLSNGCRVREYSRYGKPYRWVVELRDDRLQTWKPDWDCAEWNSAFWIFWRRPDVNYLQNHLIQLDLPGLSCAA